MSILKIDLRLTGEEDVAAALDRLEEQVDRIKRKLDAIYAAKFALQDMSECAQAVDE